MKFVTLFLILPFLLQSTSEGAETPKICKEIYQIVRAETGARHSGQLKAVMDKYWDWNMKEYPEWATSVGYKGPNDSWTDYSPQAIQSRKDVMKCFLEDLKYINPKSLKGEDLVTYNLVVNDTKLNIDGQKYPSELTPLNQLGGVQIDVPDLLGSSPHGSKKDFQAILSRLQKLPKLISQNKDLLKEGLKRHVVPAKIFMTKVPGQIDTLLAEDVASSALFDSFKSSNIPKGLDIGDLPEQAKVIIKNEIYPALRDLKEFLVKDYIPGCRDEIAWSSMPDGKNWYNYQIKYHTTTDMTADQLHELGLKEVERVKSEMEKIKNQVGFKGSLQDFNKYLNTDSKFYYSKADDLLVGYRDIAKRIDAELPRFFGKLPRNSYGVREMPAYKAKDAPTAYYDPGSLQGGRPGFFEANTYDLKVRPKWGMEALTLHESVPGHHLQISLAQELDGLPDYRKNSGYTAFVEGWALYCESLGEQMGFYKDPYSKYGELTYDIWRAIRLVVDTGMHSKGWTRDQAINYFLSLTPKSRLEVEVEVDRYIAWPGQALAYKVGQLKFLELRKRAQDALGDNFDIRKFHDEVLGHGAVPIPVLEKSFNNWLSAQTKLAEHSMK